MNSIFRALFRFALVFLAGVSCLSAQSKQPDDLAVGKILVAPRDVSDPIFKESVILLVRYGPTGALGLMLNHPTRLPISHALSGIHAAANHSDPVYVGGPVDLRAVFALTSAANKPDGASSVIAHVFFIFDQTSLERSLSASSTPATLRVYLGYCGWGPGQLDAEVSDGRWLIFPATEAAAFDPHPDSLWGRFIVHTEQQIARLAPPRPPR